MRIIHKQPIYPNSIRGKAFEIRLKVQPGSVLRFIGEQEGYLCVWYECDDDVKETSELIILCIGTGHGAVPEGGRYFSSIVNGPYTWHFYLPA